MAFNQNKINLVPKYDYNRTWYEDENGLLKGKWSYKESKELDNLGNKMIELYFSEYQKYIPITISGLFYQIFSCQKYDCIIKACGDIYITKIKEKYGVIDRNEKEILPVIYESIRPVVRYSEFLEDYLLLFIVKCEKGMFLYNYNYNTESKPYETLIRYNDDYYIFKKDNKHGLISIFGTEILPALYNYYRHGSNWRKWLSNRFKGKYCNVFVENNLLFGEFEIEDKIYYKINVYSHNRNNYIYITEENGKYGLVSENGKIIENPILDDIITLDSRDSMGYLFAYIEHPFRRINDLLFVIAKLNNKYRLYDIVSGKCILENCENIRYFYSLIFSRKGGHGIIEFLKNGEKGYVSTEGEIIDTRKYDKVILEDGKFRVQKNNKVGLLYISGQEFIPCVYDDILKIDEYNYTLIKDGEKIEYSIEDELDTTTHYSDYESQHYDIYDGAYGYSDEEIDTIFDGEPDAYWNID